MSPRGGPSSVAVRNLVFVLGDQLDRTGSAFDGFDERHDVVFMAEVPEEARHVWSHRARIAVFLSAMRHFRDELRAEGYRVDYREIDLSAPGGGFAEALQNVVRRLQPRRIVVTQPGEWRVLEALRGAARDLGVELEIRPDRHFFCSDDEFAEHLRGRRQPRMEFFYRALRKRHGILMDGTEPASGIWNFDSENRGSFRRDGPGTLRAPRSFVPDATTRTVLELVQRDFGDHPGELSNFGWPTSRAQAVAALDDFVQHRLSRFGAFQDAMWRGQPFLYHATISAALNLKLLSPREVVAAAEGAYRADPVAYPLPAVEGFIRQVLGWREYVRGIYRHFMPEYATRNELGAEAALPSWYWTGETEMSCLSEAIGQTIAHGYAHHIQRLMVTGLYALLLAVRPKEIHAWYLAMYVDAVEWVELPNTLGMSQYADGGLMASKPYVATGKYIQKMSNYCDGCRFDPALATGPNACPFTTLYWNFLDRHEQRFRDHPRMALQVRNLARKSDAERKRIAKQAEELRGGGRAGA